MLEQCEACEANRVFLGLFSKEVLPDLGIAHEHHELVISLYFHF